MLVAGDIGGAMLKAFLPYLGVALAVGVLGAILRPSRKAKRSQRGSGKRVAPRAATTSGGLFRRLPAGETSISIPATRATRGAAEAPYQSCANPIAQPASERECVCPSCARSFQVSTTQVGLDVQCPSCRLVFTLPTLGGQPATAHSSPPPAPAPKPELTLALLQELEWKRFEQVTEAYFQQVGWGTQAARIGPDGGVDIHLTRPGSQGPGAVVQCKAWNSYKVGVKPVRELFGVMAADTVPEGFFVTTSEYTTEARAFADGKRLVLIDGPDFVRRVQALPPDAHARLYATASTGDYRTPTFPSCGRKMVPRVSGKGRSAGLSFWGCPSYPDCFGKIPMRAESALEQSQHDLIRSDLCL